MTLTLSPLSTALRTTVLMVAALAAAPSIAAGNSYSATLVSAPTEAKVMAAGTVFVCKGTDCTARETASSPMRVCSALAKATGPVTAFSFAGKAFDDAKLAKCNGAES